MSLKLARFSQEVDVATGNMAVAYFAVFQSDDGRELKLPISQEASQTIISFFADPSAPAAKPEAPEEIPEPEAPEETEGATTFGEEDDYQVEEPPGSEEEVPSL